MIGRQTSNEYAAPSAKAWIGLDVFRAIVRSLCALWFRLEVIGPEHIPPTGAFIVSPVHRNYIDTLLILAITRRRLRFMGRESLWDYRSLGWFLSRMGGIPLKRGTATRTTLRIAQGLLESGESLVIFPEGSNGAGPVVEEFFDGPAYLASHHGVPIIPVGIGAARPMDHGDRIVWPTKVVVVVGEPLWSESGTDDRADGEGGRRLVPRRVVSELSEALRTELQRLFDEAQERAGTPNSSIGGIRERS